MFRDSLKRLVEQTEGGVAGLLMGFDGIAVESFAKEPKDQSKTDIQTVGMEFSYILTQVRKAADTIDAGSVEEVAIRTDRMTLIIRVLSRDYFVALAIAPTGNTGKGRYLLRMTAPKIQAEL
jgi:predicted regulator of Ras-like GTPase activity (Roadblock/LC7/MglB family)